MGGEIYLRKVNGQFEYGFVTRAKNFRKQSDKFAPIGIKPTCAEAIEAMNNLPRAGAEAGSIGGRQDAAEKSSPKCPNSEFDSRDGGQTTSTLPSHDRGIENG